MNINLNERLKQYQRNHYASKKTKKIKHYVFVQYQMSKKTFKFAKNIVDKDKIVISEKFKHNEKGSNILLVTKMIILLDICVLFSLR